MNGLLWIAQIVLAGVFLFTAGSKLFAYQNLVNIVETRSKGRPIGMSRWQAAVVALAEIGGAVGVVTPIELEPRHLIILLAAGWLALIMVGAGIYHLRRTESAAPSISIFLLALFVIVGRWPR